MTRARVCIGFVLLVLAVSGLAACSRDPNVRKQKYVESGDRYFSKGKFREAGIQYANAVKIDPQFATARFKMAKASMAIGDWNAAFGELLRVVDLQPDNYEAQIELGKLFFAARQYKQAKEKGDLVLEKQPDNVDAHALNASALAGLQHYDESLAEIKAAIKVAPDRSDLFLTMGSIKAAANDPVGAENDLKKAAALDPKSSIPQSNLAEFYLKLSRFSDAEAALKQAIAIDSKNASLRASLARLYIRIGQPQAAEETLVEAKRDLKSDPDAYRLLGDFYASTGAPDKAIAEYGLLYKEHPDDIRVATNYASLMIRSNRLDEAEAVDSALLKKNPKSVDGLVVKGEILVARKQFAAAVPILESAVKAQVDNPSAHLDLGHALAGVGNMQRAESEWREAVRYRPNSVEAHRLIAEVSIQKHDAGALKQEADALIQADPKSAAGYMYQAVAASMSQQPTQVEPAIRKAMEVAPKDPMPVTKLADWRQDNRKLPDAEKLYNQALALDPSYVPAMKNLVHLYLGQNSTDKALRRVDAQLALAPNNSSFHQLKGSLLARNNDVGGATAELQKAITLDSNNTEAAIQLADLQSRSGAGDPALAALERVIQQNPRDLRAYFLLAAQHEQRGEWDKAEGDYRKVLEIQPEQPLASNNLAYLLLDHGGSADVALSLAQNARRGLPNEPLIADTLAWAYYQHGAYRSAIDLLQEATNKRPENATFHYHLGRCYASTNNPGQAKTELQRVLQLDPNYAKADDVRKVLAELK